MTERTPTPSELAAYSDFLFQILQGSLNILDEAGELSESQEVVNERVGKMLDSLVIGVDVRAVDAYLSAVEDGSPIRPMRYVLLGQVLARMFEAEDAEN